jgi:hypothetical protein
MPAYNRHDLERTSNTFHFNPGHEQMAHHMEDASFRTALIDKRDSGELPCSYFEHPVVQGHVGDEPVAAVGLFVDAVPYSLTDSAIGFWLFCLITGRRFLMGVLRKRHVCKCGCKGWCSFFCAWQLVHWTLSCLAAGTWAAGRHDGKDWRPSDAWRIPLAGTAMRLKAALVYVCVDWAECASTLGFPSWASGLRPCFECNAFADIMYSAAGHNMRALAWRENTDADYEDACLRCEVRVTLDERLRTRCCDHLKYDRRKDGSRGLALVSHVPELGLRAGDRLEPSPRLPDVSALLAMTLVVGCTIDVVF